MTPIAIKYSDGVLIFQSYLYSRTAHLYLEHI